MLSKGKTCAANYCAGPNIPHEYLPVVVKRQSKRIKVKLAAFQVVKKSAKA